MKGKYLLLDSGNYQKLEMIDGYKIIRPSLNSPYPPSNPKLWEYADAVYERNEKGSGSWKYYKEIPESLFIHLAHNVKIKIKLTPFGHIGFFPEQVQNWELLFTLGKKNPNLEVLNLFAYSGVSTLYCLSSGMKVCHVDSSKGMVEWAKENAKLSGLESMPVRWIVDDVTKFIKREIRRQKKYDGFILDPPTFGRGAKGEVWKIEEDLPELMELLMQLCNLKPKFVFLSCHTTGYSPMILERLLQGFIQEKESYTSGEMFIEEKTGSKLSGGFFANFLSKNLVI